EAFPVAAVSPRDSLTMRTPALAPMRVAPAATMAFICSRSRTPPDAFTPISSPTTRRIRATSAAVAPPGPKPVEVFTKSGPAAGAAICGMQAQARRAGIQHVLHAIGTAFRREAVTAAPRRRHRAGPSQLLEDQFDHPAIVGHCILSNARIFASRRIYRASP